MTLKRRFLRPPYSFRQKLAFSIAIAALLTAFIEGALDIFFDAQIASFREANTSVLSQESAVIAFFLEFRNGEPYLSEGALGRLDPDTRFQLLRDDEVVLSGPEPFPADNAAWAVREGFVEGDYHLQIARPTSSAEQLFLNDLFLDLLDIPLFFLLALLVAWSLTRFALKPIRELTKAFQTMAQQQFPEAIAVPPGNDELSNMAQSFNLMQGSISTLIDRERAFTRYASHELRTPLSAMKLQLESLELGLSPTEKVLPSVTRNLERMQRVLEALLSLARSSEKNHEPVSLLRLVEESIQLLPTDAQARIDLTSQVLPSYKVSNPYLLGQCILNLIDNAVKYSPGRVEVALEQLKNEVVVRVRDEGGGVPEAQLDSLTHTFFRLSKNVEGSGLGLAFVKHIVRTLGGQLELRNTDRGLEVALTLPKTAATVQP